MSRVYLTEPPPPSTGTEQAPLFLTGVHRASFRQTSEPSPDLAEFTADLAALHGFPVREQVLARPHPSYALMAEAVRARLDPATDPVDLLVLAYAVPEVDPARCTTTRLHHGSPGDPFGFCVSDQGTTAPFTGLTLISEYLRCGASRRAMLLVLEQGELAYEVPAGTVLPSRDTAVGLLLDAAPPGGTSSAVEDGARVVALRQLTAIAPDEVEAAVAVELAALPAGPPATLIRADGTETRDGMLCTAAWWELAGILTRTVGSPQRTVIVDYEPTLRYLSLLAVDASGSLPTEGME